MQMDNSNRDQYKVSENAINNTCVTESSQESSTTTELRLRSHERAKQIKKAREDFLCIPSTMTENKINTASSVGDLPLHNENWHWKRKLKSTVKKSISSNEGFIGIPKDTGKKHKSLQRGGYTIFENYENQITHNSSNITEKNTNFRQDKTAINTSYSCPSSPKL